MNHLRMKAFALASSFVFLCGCTTIEGEFSGKSVHVYGSREYTHKVNNFSIDIDHAKRIMAWYRSEHHGPLLLQAETPLVPPQKSMLEQRYEGLDQEADPPVIVDHYYVFPHYRDKRGTPLSGFYVDGMTGSLEVRLGEGLLLRGGLTSKL